MDGAEYLDAIELDMGKMFQSILTKYEIWSQSTEKLVDFSKDGFSIKIFNNSLEISKFISLWSSIIQDSEEILYAKAYFYTALHMIRMIRFRLKISEDQATYALLMSIILLNSSLSKLNGE